MTPQELKNSILQLALQGKLTGQRFEDGTTMDVYQKMQDNLSKMSAKERKKEVFDEITIDEIPFEIPPSWKWVRWGNLSQEIQYGYNASAQETGRIKMLRISDIQNGKVSWNTVPYCEINEKEIPNYVSPYSTSK